MSEFGVFLNEIEDVSSHPNADKLELATLKDKAFQFVVLKGKHKPGDIVLYFMVESLLPENVIQALGLTGRLSGSAKNRVKTVRLRGEYSQGIVEFPAVLFPDGATDPSLPDPTTDPEFPMNATEGFGIALNRIHDYDFAPLLGVTKHEPMERNPGGVPGGGRSRSFTLPSGIGGVYDIESVQSKWGKIKNHINDEVVITEKLEGSNVSIVAERNDDGSINTYTCSRRMRLERLYDPETNEPVKNGFLDQVEKQGLDKTVAWVLGRYPEARYVRLLGEFIGFDIQKNIYKLPNGHREIRVFDLIIDGRYIDADTFSLFVYAHQLPHAPVIFRGTLAEFVYEKSEHMDPDSFDPKDLVEKSNRQSVLAPVRAEGIVIRPLKETTIDNFGRFIFKIRSPEYLANEK